MNDKERELMRDLEMNETGRDFLEDAELPKHTNPLPKEDNDIKHYEKLNAIIIPEGATNGDMIMAMFANCEVSIHEYMGIKCGVDVKIYFSENESFTAWFPSCLWNAPYKKEVDE